MKKLLYLLCLLVITCTAHSQGFIKKLKDKASNMAGGNKTAAGSMASSSNTSFTEPSQLGVPIYQLSKQQSMIGDGMVPLSLEWAAVVNNDLHAKMNIDGQVYEYANGQLKATGEKFVQHSGFQFMRNEKDLQCVNMSTDVQSEYLLKKEPRICSGPIRGQANQTYTFKGKLLANGIGYVARNYDSSAIVVVGSEFAAGKVNYFMVTSQSQRLVLPTLCMAVYISPDGKTGATYHQTGMGADFYLTDGRKIPISQFPGGDYNLWIRNSGNIFTKDAQKKLILRNDQPFLDLSGQDNINFGEVNLFISDDEKSAAWFGGYTGTLHFTDGVVVENAFGAQRVILNNKETIVFMAGSVKDNKLYLCRKEL
jgi:hypothetical protein